MAVDGAPALAANVLHRFDWILTVTRGKRKRAGGACLLHENVFDALLEIQKFKTMCLPSGK